MTDLSPMDPPATLPPALVAETRAEQLLASCQRVPEVIDNQDDAKGATEMIKLLRSCRKALDEKRLALTRPLDEVKAAIMGSAKLLTEPLQHWEETVNERLTLYQKEVRRKMQEEEAAALKAAEEAALAEAQKLEDEGEPDEAQEALELAVDMPAPAAPDSGRIRSELGAGASLQEKWVPDFENAKIEEIPLEWLMINERKVKAAVVEGTRDLKQGQSFAIKGIPIVQVAKSRVS